MEQKRATKEHSNLRHYPVKHNRKTFAAHSRCSWCIAGRLVTAQVLDAYAGALHVGFAFLLPAVELAFQPLKSAHELGDFAACFRGAGFPLAQFCTYGLPRSSAVKG